MVVLRRSGSCTEPVGEVSATTGHVAVKDTQLWREDVEVHGESVAQKERERDRD